MIEIKANAIDVRHVAALAANARHMRMLRGGGAATGVPRRFLFQASFQRRRRVGRRLIEAQLTEIRSGCLLPFAAASAARKGHLAGGAAGIGGTLPEQPQHGSIQAIKSTFVSYIIVDLLKKCNPRQRLPPPSNEEVFRS